MRASRIFWVGMVIWMMALIPSHATTEATPAPTESTVIYPRSAEKNEGSSPARGEGGSMLLVVVALLMAAAGGWLFWKNRRLPGGGVAVRHLAIAETKSLGNRQYLVVAAYQDKKFLLSVCPGRIDLLTALDEKSDSQKL